MMGRQTGDQSQLFYLFNLERRIPAGHLLRRINPVVTQILVELRDRLAAFYSDIGRPSIDPELMIRMGAVIGVWIAHLMFELPVWEVSLNARTGTGQWLAEFVATFGLLLTILGCVPRTPVAVPYAVGLYITSAYWFTASTSFANPTMTIARSLSDTFAGIAPTGVAAFIAAQLLGMLTAVVLGRWLWRT